MRHLRLVASNRPALAPVTERAIRSLGLAPDVAAVVGRDGNGNGNELTLAVGETVVAIRAERDASGAPTGGHSLLDATGAHVFGLADLPLARALDAVRGLGGLAPAEVPAAVPGEWPVSGEELAATLWRCRVRVQAIGDDEDHLLVASLGGRKVFMERDRHHRTLWHARDAQGRAAADPMPWHRLVDWASAEDTLPAGFGSAA